VHSTLYLSRAKIP